MAREEKVKSLRIIQIDEEIRSGSYPNGTTLAKKFEVSRATIMRDIEFLRDRYNAPLEFDQSKNGYYYTDSTYFIQSVMLSEGELFTVSTIMPLLEQYKNTPLEESFKKIMEKMTKMLPDQVSVDSYFMNRDIKFISDPLPKIKASVFDRIFKSARLKLTISCSYRSLNSQDYAFRNIDPYHILCQKGNWYVLGYCHEAEQVRVFSIARMKDVKVGAQSFTVPEGFDIKNFIDPNFGIWSNGGRPVKIELLFDKKVNTYIIEREWHTTQEIHQQDDGSVYLSITTNQMQEIEHWVRQFGSSVKVLNPPELRERIIAEAEKIMHLYKGNL